MRSLPVMTTQFDDPAQLLIRGDSRAPDFQIVVPAPGLLEDPAHRVAEVPAITGPTVASARLSARNHGLPRFRLRRRTTA